MCGGNDPESPNEPEKNARKTNKQQTNKNQIKNQTTSTASLMCMVFKKLSTAIQWAPLAHVLVVKQVVIACFYFVVHSTHAINIKLTVCLVCCSIETEREREKKKPLIYDLNLFEA